MSTLSEDLDEFGVDPRVADFMHRVAAGRNVHSQHVPKRYVSLRPDPRSFIAIYAHQAYVTIVVDTADANRVAAATPHARVERRKGPTTYLRVDAHALHSERVIHTATEALDWRAMGRRRRT